MLSILPILSIIAVLLWERPPVPNPIHQLGSTGEPFTFDVVLVDDPQLPPGALDALVRPMAMVWHHRWPDVPYNARIAVYPGGFPMRYARDSVPAAYISSEDVFLLNAHYAISTRPDSVSLQAWFAFLMAHEATHRWQAVRGDSMGDGSPKQKDAYARDPIEREAFQEGVTVASVISSRPIEWHGRDSTVFTSPAPNPYTSLDYLVHFEIRVHEATTFRGRLRQFWERIWTFF